MKYRRLIYIVMVYLNFINFAHHAQAQTNKPKPHRIPIDTSKSVSIHYQQPNWNTDSKKIESSSILFKDLQTGKMVQILLEEIQPDSPSFTGMFSISWGELKNMEPEIYIPAKNVMAQPDSSKQLQKMLNEGKLTSKPFVIRREGSGLQAIDVFDNKEDAKRAQARYKAQQQAKKRSEAFSQKLAGVKDGSAEATKLAGDNALKDSEKLAAKRAADLALAKSVEKQAAERARMEQIEKERLLAQKQQLAQLNKKQLEERKKQAAEAAAQAMQAYQAGNYVKAEQLFRQSVDLDPNNKQFYYQYGITLYRNEKINEALVILKMSDGPQVNPIEKTYYQALCYYKLQEYDAALKDFVFVKTQKDPTMSASGAFYEGIILIEKRKYEQAKESFQYVLDNSTDPRLDQKAEEYIENIIQLMQFETKRKKPYTLTISQSMMYDSNVVFASDSNIDQGVVTNEKGIRFLTGVGLDYRAIYEPTYELTPKINLTNFFTVTDGFETAESLSDADPLLLRLSLPYTRKSIAFGKAWKMGISPAYESVAMSTESNNRKSIVSSLLTDIDSTLVLTDYWFASLTLGLRSDDATTKSSVGDADSSAFKWSLTYSNTYFMDSKRTKGLIGDIGYTDNAAKGINYKFNRYDLSLMYVYPLPWEMVGNAKIAYYKATYGDIDRDDTNWSYTVGAVKPVYEWLSSMLSIGYNTNDSTDDSYTYKKITAMLGFSARFDF